MKRIVLFLATNIAIIVVLSIVLRILGVDRYLTANGLNYQALLIFASVFGFGGAFISLAMSKWIAKKSTGAHVIEAPSNATEQWLVDTVTREAQMAGIGMPEVAVYDSPDPNAFATGMSRNNSLVAVSTGLLQSMNADEVEAVLAHEVSHIANGDMVTLTLVQGVVNTFVIFLARVVGYFVDQALFRNSNEQASAGTGIGYMITVVVLEIVFGVVASIIVAWFSRQREFRADAGSARLVGADKMIRALQRLGMGVESQLPAQVEAFGISGKTHGLSRLFMSHPPLEERIEALQRATYR